MLSVTTRHPVMALKDVSDVASLRCRIFSVIVLITVKVVAEKVTAPPLSGDHTLHLMAGRLSPAPAYFVFLSAVPHSSLLEPRATVQAEKLR